ncbi:MULTISPECIES: rubrerythrin family protein [Dehalobacter]|jgi:rubrerythrin|uniref:Rubrerythrin family protein n=2 Tax=Dehalobacter restrictus TaxID=55583 RepID=A0A857DJJ9_9FIRM|nr:MULTISPECIES: rubrerythrin family protein [Dehalobacter]AHF10037.1 rubrerythrin [Dehalobacter restrictus DSM 9455]MCG1025121.1 rubrerythrin family protein [Dehalobacter sp.]OCZ52483.1 rubrerythrin [Dehalobacter sp. TeCB1]QHA00639.1 rubrerythrin family protein [Dehalobacter restrictus]
MTSQDNMKESFAGESQANRKYTAFAQKAEEEGYNGAAKLFRAAAEAEALHALSQMKVLGMLKSTEENLKAGIDGETFEFTKMYPRFLEKAKDEGDSEAQRVFHLANEAEKSHAALYKDALKDLTADNDYYYCQVCGYIHKNEAPEKCPVCGAPSSKFKNVQ